MWHYQTTPGDSWDYTATQHMSLADLDIDGETRKVLMQAPKNGFFYVLDRATGELLSAEKFGKVTWASHVDSDSGRPVVTAHADFSSEPELIYPGQSGAHNWHPMSFNGGTEPGGLISLQAWDPVAREERWRVPVDMSLRGDDVPIRPKVDRTLWLSEPPDVPTSQEMVGRSAEQFETARCSWCHSGAPAIVPNLLELTPEKHAVFKDIVLGGALEARGMASFADVLSGADGEAIQAYIVDRTRREIANGNGG